MSSNPWIDEHSGYWGSYEDRKIVADLITEHITSRGKDIYAISGDAHMLAFDDGSNNNAGGFSVIQGAALDQHPSCKGGPYSHGAYPGSGQFAKMQLKDDGEDVCLRLWLMREDDALIEWDSCHPEEYPGGIDYDCANYYRYLPGGTLFEFLAVLALLALAGLLMYYFIYKRTEKQQQEREKVTIQLTEQVGGNEPRYTQFRDDSD